MTAFTRQLAHHGHVADLDVPATAPIDPFSGWTLIDEIIALPPFDEARWRTIRLAATDITVHNARYNPICRIGVGRDRARLVLMTDGHDTRPHTYCDTCKTPSCHHLLALILGVLHADPAHRARLYAPGWKTLLAPAPPHALPTPDPDRHRGWVRATLHTGFSDEAHALADGRLTLWLMRRSKRTNKPLKPQKLPATLADAERRVRGLSDGERALLGPYEEYRALADVNHGYADPAGQLAVLYRRCVADIFAALGDVTELYLDDAPIRYDATPYRPRLIVDDAADGGLTLGWADPPEALFRYGADYVVIAGALRPLDPATPVMLRERLRITPPPVPPDQIAAFVEHVVVPGRVPLALRTDALTVTERPPAPRLLLAAEPGALLVALRYAYGAVEAGPDDPDVLYDAFDDPPQLIRRDPDRERALWRRLGDVVDPLPDAPATLHFRGDAAYDFLDLAPAALPDFEFATDRSLDLDRWKPRGTLGADARLAAGLDWFDLDVAFAVDGPEAGAATRAAVLESWRAGRRYVTLTDGGVARLPDVWLDRHGAALAELDELRGRRRRVGAFAAPLVADLLDDLLDDASAHTETHAALDRLRDLAARIRDFDRIPERPTPPGLRATLRPYQHRGYRWMSALAALGLGGVLADDMGLGKTVQTLTTLLDAHRSPSADPTADPRPSLVVAPTSVIHNWLAEAARFTPDLTVALHHGPKRGEPPRDVDLVVTSYPLLRIDADALHAIEWRYVVLDEAQHIKNPQSKLARAARDLTAAHRFALTGTPLENSLIELWSLFEFLMPGFFASREAYRRRYVQPTAPDADPDDRAAAFEALRRRIRPFVLRRLKREVAAELPPRQEQTLWCDLSRPERRLYDAVRETYRESVLDRVADVGIARSAIQILEALTRLRQAACDPALLPFPEARATERAIKRSAKRAALIETLTTLTAEGHRALVFSQWPSLLRRVAADLDAHALPYLYLDGSTRDRADLQTRWNAPDGPPVFLISLKAGGTGLNLTGADVVIHLDPWWNPQAEQQATDRAHRIGQTKPVMVYKLVARGTVEEKVIELQARKRALFEAAVDGDRVTVDALSREDLEAVFRGE